MKREITAPEGAAGERLDLFLAPKLETTRSHVQRLIRTGRVSVAGTALKTPGHLLKGEELIAIDLPDPNRDAPPPPKLTLLYEDAAILVVDKPAGLAVHAGAGLDQEATVADFARSRTTDPDQDRSGMVHRLDRDTSGALIIAKSPEAKAFMQHEFAARHVEKTYYALLSGRLEPADAIVRLNLDRDPLRPTRRAVSPTGRPAETTYHALAYLDGYTLIKAKPLTGRTHQLRVHFASLGHPVAGDVVYGPAKRPLGLKRQFLHAARLSFTSPTGQPAVVTSPLPTDLELVLHTLGASGIIGE